MRSFNHLLRPSVSSRSSCPSCVLRVLRVLQASSRLFLIAVPIVPLWVAAVVAEPPRTWLKEERFDRDPGWDAARNRVEGELRVKHQDFGYRPGPDGAKHGRIGGTVWRSIAPAHYAMRLPALSLEESFSASGTVALTHATTTVGWQNGSTLFVGFFNRRAQGWRPVDFVGFRLEGFNEPDGANVEVGYGTRVWTAGGAFVNAGGGAQERLVRDLDSAQLLRIAPDGRRHRWSLRYDPEPGAGRITFVFDGAETVHALRPEHRRQGAALDRFGLFNGQMPGNELTAYFDDLTVNGRRIDLAADPGWEGRGNRARLEDRLQYGANDFGYRRSHRAGGGRGELGGRLWRVQEPESMGYYGDDVGTLTLDDPLFASGRIAFSRFSVDTGMHVGWFNHREQGWPPRNFVGIYLDSQSVLGRFMTPMYGTSQARREQEDGRTTLLGAASGGHDLLFYPNGRTYQWSLRYDPQAAGGNGAVTLALGDRSVTLPLQPGARAEGAVMDRFGIFNMQDNNGKDCEVFLDDLRYTTARSGDRHRGQISSRIGSPRSRGITYCGRPVWSSNVSSRLIPRWW
jgi:hypothetical protein